MSDHTTPPNADTPPTPTPPSPPGAAGAGSGNPFANVDPGKIGMALVILGALALLSNLGLFGGSGGLFGALLFAAGGAFLVRVYDRKASRIWALVGGFALFGLAAASIGGALAGLYFLGLLGGGFLLAYRNDRRQWWAIIPGGVLMSVALVAGLEELAPRFDEGPILFLGLAATFGALYRLPEGGKRWAIYPAIAAVVIAILAIGFGGSWFLPLLLVGGGAYLLTRHSSPVTTAPVQAPTRPDDEPAVPAPAEADELVEPARKTAPREGGGDEPAAPDAAEADAG